MRFILAGMAMRENEFEVRLGRTSREGASSLKRVRAAVRIRSGGKRVRLKSHAVMKSRAHGVAMRRVIVKGRLVPHGGVRGASLKAHVRYLGRTQKTQDRADTRFEARDNTLPEIEAPGRDKPAFYNGREDNLDAQALTAAWADDARHLRLVISAEDGEALGDLRPMTREVMARLEVKLATRLNWLAVDHWDTDNPHTHVLVQGKTSDGQDLSLSWKTINRDIRLHAEEVATRVLGPRQDADIRQERLRESNRMGVTALDRRLAALADEDGLLAVRRPELIARLDVLEVWGLARANGDTWRLSEDLIGSLREMEQHAEVEQAVTRHRSNGRQLPVFAADRNQAIEGVLVHLGPADVFEDDLLAVIETGRGDLRYQRFEREEDLARLRGLRPGAILAFTPNASEIQPSDQVIAAIAEGTGGIYSAEHHFNAAPEVSPSRVAANIRRLEAMRRVSLIARTEAGDFIAGDDHLRRARIYEERIAQRYPLSPAVLSYWTLEEQLKAIGPTHLDRVLAGEAKALEGRGDLAIRHAQALQQRRVFLIEQGWLRDGADVLSRSVLKRMADRELRAAADDLAVQLGKPVSTTGSALASGVYVRRIDLAQGRRALVIDDRQASLLPWRAEFEPFLARNIETVMRGSPPPWDMRRGKGLAIG